MQTQSGTVIEHILLFQSSFVDTGFLVTPRPPFCGFGWFPFVAGPLEFSVYLPSLFSCWWYFHELLRNLLYIHVSDEQILPFVWPPFVQGGLLFCFPNAELKFNKIIFWVQIIFNFLKWKIIIISYPFLTLQVMWILVHIERLIYQAFEKIYILPFSCITLIIPSTLTLEIIDKITLNFTLVSKHSKKHVFKIITTFRLC